MGTLKEDIYEQADWVVRAFAEDKLILDYTIKSFIAIDKFISRNTKKGKAIRGGRFSKNAGGIIFSIGAYIGNTIIKNIPGAIWNANDESSEIDISIVLPDGSIIWPVQKIIKRFRNGPEDSIYFYGYEITKDVIKGEFDDSYWNAMKESKPWWKFW